jgi:predicted kinase
MLIVMAGLPGSGKSAIADAIGETLRVPVLSVDPVEAAMYRAGIDSTQPVGLAAYVVVEAVASDILALRQDVVIDAVNAVDLARQMWRDLAARHDVTMRWIEVECPDPVLHRSRLESRRRGSRAADEPTWEDVQLRREEFEPWPDERLRLDTTEDLPSNIARALRYVTPESGF